MLNLYEQYYILCLHEEKTVATQAAEDCFPYWFEAALLADLALGNRIAINKNHRVSLISAEPTGDPLQDDLLQKIQSLESAKKISYWMNDLEFKSKKVFRQISEQLLTKGILKQEDDEFSWALTEPEPDGLQASAKFRLRSRLRLLALARSEPNLQDLALLSLLKASDKLDLVFFKDERKLIARWIDERMMAEALQDPAAQTIQEIESVLAAHVDED